MSKCHVVNQAKTDCLRSCFCHTCDLWLDLCSA